MRIMHNIPALQSYNALTVTNNNLSKSINRLSTGLRINSAADDAAGLAISEKMRAQISGLNQAASNAQDGISMIQTAEGALGETHSMLQRMRELSVQAANDTLTQEDRSYIQLEIDQLKEEIDRISTTTQFNKKQLLDGSGGALWSTDNLQTKVIVNGGLRMVDQFGQKAAAEGNYKITINSLPGKAQVQKTDIFKIKHKNVIMNASLNTAAGFASVRVDSLPAGTYNVSQISASVAGGQVAASYFSNGDVTLSGVFGVSTFDFAGAINFTANLSIKLEVVQVDAATNSITFRVQTFGVDENGKSISFTEENFMVTSSGVNGQTVTSGVPGNIKTSIGLYLQDATDISLVASGALNVNKGDKIIINTWLASDATTTTTITVSGTVNMDWDQAWTMSATGEAATFGTKYGLNASEIEKNEVHFKNFYLNTENGTVHEGTVVVSFSEDIEADTQAVGATFEAAFVGQTAKGDVQLRDLDKFWDANGKFLLDTAKTISVIQGDGTKASITIYQTDTLNDVKDKLNTAIAYGLGQAQYASKDANNFVSFVEDPIPNGPESVRGTFIIRSLVPGLDGELSFSGDEDIIRAFSLNTIQDAVESQFRIGVYDAHTNATVATNVKISGNTLYGIVHPNIDVRFDPMANIEARWNEKTKSFDLVSQAQTYETIVHLSDNTTVFQIGANESEDMSIDIGDMSSAALRIQNIIVTNRESAAKAIGKIDEAIGMVSRQRAKLGAYQNRLEHTIANLTTAATNTTAAESRIRDADMAKEMMEFTKLNILSQAGNSMLAQANQLPQNVMALLRG